jgi:hypothetical protein
VATKNGTVLGKNPTLAPGDIVILKAQGFAASEKVEVALDGKSLGTVTAATAGSISDIFAVPADQPNGSASVTFTGGDVTRTFDFTATAASATTTSSPSDTIGAVGAEATPSGSGSTLPFTGSNALGLAGIAFLLMLLGAAGILGERRLKSLGGKFR